MRRLLRLAAIVVVVLVVLAVVAAALGPSPQTPAPGPTTSFSQDAMDAALETAEAALEASDLTRCEPVSADVVAGIETGLTVDGGGSLRGAQAVRSRDFQKFWFVAADIQGLNMEGDGEIAVWAMNDPSARGAGLTIAVDGLAKEFSDWGSADRSGQFTLNDDGIAEARECVRNAL